MVTYNRVTTLQNHSVSTLSSEQHRQRFGQKMGLNQLSCLRGLSEKAMVLTHLQCLILFSFFLVFLASDFYYSYILLHVTENAIQVNNFGMLS